MLFFLADNSLSPVDSGAFGIAFIIPLSLIAYTTAVIIAAIIKPIQRVSVKISASFRLLNL